MRRGALAGLVAGMCAMAWAAGAWLAEPVLADPGHSALEASTASVQEHEFAGAREGCRRCHLREYRSWEDTPHASALERLEGADAANPECLQCHTTGYGTPSGFVSRDETPELAGVTCESCHGAGADYRDREVMKDREASLAAGLHLPDEATCRGCHNEQSPTFPGEFDYEEMLANGVHEIRR